MPVRRPTSVSTPSGFGSRSQPTRRSSAPAGCRSDPFLPSLVRRFLRPLPAASERERRCDQTIAVTAPSTAPPQKGCVGLAVATDAGRMGHTAERRARAALLLLTFAVAVCATQFTLHVADSVQGLVEMWIYEPTVVVAGLVCMARGFVGRTERAAWSLIGLGVLLWGVGDTIWTFVYVDDASPAYPCVSDAFWLALYPPIYVGFLLLVRSRAGGLRRSLWLDGVMASLAVAALGTAFVFHAVLDAT